MKIVAIADCVRISDGSGQRSGHLPGPRGPTVPSSPLIRLGANLTSATTARSDRSIMHVRGTSAAARPTSRVLIPTMARARAATGVETEALTAASIAALTVYDCARPRARTSSSAPFACSCRLDVLQKKCR